MNNNMIEIINQHVWVMTRAYMNLPIHETKVRTPYYINKTEGFFLSLMRKSGISQEKLEEVHTRYKNREIPFGWYRGKGTPEEITAATIEIARIFDFKLTTSTKEGIRDFMKMYGLGVDCSGYVYNVLNFAFKQIHQELEFNSSLNWKSEKTGVNYADVTVFTGTASNEIALKDLKELDIRVIKEQDVYSHISLIIRKPKTDQLYYAESTLGKNTSGITILPVSIEDNILLVNKKEKPLGTADNKMTYELRRLKILE